MKMNYKLIIDNPSTHQVHVIIKLNKPEDKNRIHFFLPRWSPGSYLMREYSRHVSKLEATTSNGQRLFLEQTDISSWTVDFEKSDLAKDALKNSEITLSYDVYCHELTVRTSHVDESHAFLHLPTLLMGVEAYEMDHPELRIEFPPMWSKVTTGLKDISTKREEFIYTAEDYDDLIDSPIEIGCQETDGFMVDNVPHEIAFYGNMLPHTENIKADTKKIVEHIAHYMGGFPYEKYSFITHFVPGLYGGLEHKNSTALQFCPTGITNRKGYINYLALISHEYFHTWNVKRIRPFELGPFNYLREATSNLLWLAEGLTSLMDELFIYRAGLITLEEYLEMQRDNLNRYYAVPGRRFHSLDESSFNSWIKLYRPDENTNNSSVSYYLKGGIVFWALNLELSKQNKSINDLLGLLWKDYLENPERGVVAEDVYKMVETVGGADVRAKFESWTQTTDELDIETIAAHAGLKIEWDNSEAAHLGFSTKHEGDRVIIASVTLDGPAYQAGLNAGDELIAINGMRVLKDKFAEFAKFLRINETYTFTVARLSTLQNVGVTVGNKPASIKAIVAQDKAKAEKALNP